MIGRDGQQPELPTAPDWEGDVARTVPGRAFGAFHHRDFRLFWWGLVISHLGGWMQQVAQSWLIYELTGSPLLLGINGLFRTIPFLAISLYAGTVVDRVDRKKLLFWTEQRAWYWCGPAVCPLPPGGGGLGRGAVLASQRGQDRLLHALQFLQHRVVPESQNAKSFSCQPEVALAVAQRAQVLASVDLHDQAAREAHEIDNVGSDRLLALELVPSESPRTQSFPEPPFGVRLVGPQAFRSFERGSPSPSPSPARGEGIDTAASPPATEEYVTELMKRRTKPDLHRSQGQPDPRASAWRSIRGRLRHRRRLLHP